MIKQEVGLQVQMQCFIENVSTLQIAMIILTLPTWMKFPIFVQNTKLNGSQIFLSFLWYCISSPQLWLSGLHISYHSQILKKKTQPKAAKKNFISRFDIHILDC